MCYNVYTEIERFLANDATVCDATMAFAINQAICQKFTAAIMAKGQRDQASIQRGANVSKISSFNQAECRTVLHQKKHCNDHQSDFSSKQLSVS